MSISGAKQEDRMTDTWSNKSSFIDKEVNMNTTKKVALDSPNLLLRNIKVHPSKDERLDDNDYMDIDDDIDSKVSK